jgi:hypothetical protein
MSSINFIDTVTHLPAEWANDVDALIYDVFQGAQTLGEVKDIMGFGTCAYQDANNVQIVGGDINATVIGLTTPANAKFENAWLVFDPTNARHAASKNYVDNSVLNAIQNFLTGVQAEVPLAGFGTIATPLRLNVNPVALPGVGARVLVQNPDDSVDSIPLGAIGGSNVLYYLYSGIANTVHLVSHMLGQKYVSVTVLNDLTDEVMIPLSIQYLDQDSLYITFTNPTSCKAIIMGAP